METSTPTTTEFFQSYAFRMGLYAAFTFVLFELVYAAVKTHGAELVSAENGPIEMTQMVLAIVGAVTLFLAAKLTPVGRTGLILCGCVVAYAAAREGDQLFEEFLFDDAYKWVVGLPMLILGATFVFIDRKTLVGDVMGLMKHPVATLFAIAGIYLCFVCQIYDRPEMWGGISMMNEADGSQLAVNKALIEEYAELFAYMLLAISGVEAAFLAFNRRAEAMSSLEGGKTNASDDSDIRIAA
ncbi:MAG: hypothetical protein ACR2NZ_17330 [Rubripirellula sp.]